jgi:hypothetical protein
MKTEIDKYRGWEIYFDTDIEKFTAYSNVHDREIEKGSYPTVKKGIDDFIKENETFRPFIITPLPGGYGKGGTVVGLRKDNVLIYEDKDGKKHQLSNYDENNFMLYNEKNDVVLAKYDQLISEANRIRTEASEYLAANIIKKTVATYRNEMGYEKK